LETTQRKQREIIIWRKEIFWFECLF
jgi:hypothetical protein